MSEAESAINRRIREGRAYLIAWQNTKRASYFEGDKNLQSVLRMYLGEDANHHWEILQHVGRQAAVEMDLLARSSNRDENLPRLRRHDEVGTRLEEVVLHPDYHSLGSTIWASGIMELFGQPGKETLAGALGYLVAHNGEAGHLCPIACTAGLIKLLQRVGTLEQKERLLPRLTSTDYAQRLHASQFVTEVQGGSDVGANDCLAYNDPARPEMYRIVGEKWFCSVADAGVFLVTARPEGSEAEGTKGLGLFLVPRTIDGHTNHFAIRRLKYKLGTRSMASAEIDFDHAIAEPIGFVHRGFKNLISIVLDTSRVHNAVAACGMMRRACVEAHSFAEHRIAFGGRVLDYPLIQLSLARMKLQTAAAVATTFRILDTTDRLTLDPEQPELSGARRVNVNINKYWTSIACTSVVRDAIEVLGGNGTIEEFSVLPRLYRDAIVIESWEGTHNTLCMQVLRDFTARGLHRRWFADAQQLVAAVERPDLEQHGARARALLAEVEGAIDRLLSTDDAEFAPLHIRQVVDRMCVFSSYASLLNELQWVLEHDRESATTKGAVVALYHKLYVDRVDPMEDDELLPLCRTVNRVL